MHAKDSGRPSVGWRHGLSRHWSGPIDNTGLGPGRISVAAHLAPRVHVRRSSHRRRSCRPGGQGAGGAAAQPIRPVRLRVQARRRRAMALALLRADRAARRLRLGARVPRHVPPSRDAHALAAAAGAALVGGLDLGLVLRQGALAALLLQPIELLRRGDATRPGARP